MGSLGDNLVVARRVLTLKQATASIEAVVLLQSRLDPIQIDLPFNPIHLSLAAVLPPLPALALAAPCVRHVGLVDVPIGNP